MNNSLDAPFTLLPGGDQDYCVLQEALVGAFGLPPGKHQVSIKGDPSLRETVPIRQRYQSRLDLHANEVLQVCQWLLEETGVYAIYIGFNSSEIRTESIFNPFNYEVHDADVFLNAEYIARHFVKVPYEEKLNTIAWVRTIIQTGPLRNYLPRHWRALMDSQRDEWQPMGRDLISQIVTSFNKLREIDGYYVRNAAISLSQAVVRTSFNCDGTYLVAADYFPQFVRENTP